MNWGPFVRATLAFLACPGMVALALPLLWLWSERAPAVHRTGFSLLGLGAAVLVGCVREFYVVGRGTLAPWDPPRHLVTSGLYRYSRNPMYVAVTAMLLGWAWTYASLPLLAYAGIVMLAFALRVVVGEEPWLARTHGTAWTAYRQRTRRWL
jgi:protein-S-isoprenylcysteine O-methyltransferase Ste14